MVLSAPPYIGNHLPPPEIYYVRRNPLELALVVTKHVLRNFQVSDFRQTFLCTHGNICNRIVDRLQRTRQGTFPRCSSQRRLPDNNNEGSRPTHDVGTISYTIIASDIPVPSYIGFSSGKDLARWPYVDVSTVMQNDIYLICRLGHDN